jgi:hypothetical protein
MSEQYPRALLAPALIYHVSWINIPADCPVRAHVNAEDHIALVFGGGASEFEIGMAPAALRSLLSAGHRAMTDLETLTPAAH